MEGTNSSLHSFIELFLLFQIIVFQKEPDHPSFLIDIKSKETFSSKKEPIGKVWYIAFLSNLSHDYFDFDDFDDEEMRMSMMIQFLEGTLVFLVEESV